MFSLHRQLPAATTALRRAHPVALLSLVLFFAWNQVAACSWRGLLRASGVKTRSLGDLVRLRIEAQAINQVIPTAGAAGEALRAVAAAGHNQLGAASLATVLDNAAGTASGLVFATGAVALYLRTHTGRTDLSALTIACTLALILLFVVIAVPFRHAPRWLPYLSETNILRALLDPLARHRHALRRAFRDAVGLRFGERLLAVGEIYVLFHSVGAPVSLSVATLISAVLVMVSFAAFVLPGQLGAAEAAVTSASALLGVPPALGLSAALLRRARQLAVCVFGRPSCLTMAWT